MAPPQTPPVQTTVHEEGFALPIKVTEGLAQVIVCVATGVIVGAMVLLDTEALIDAVQLLAVLVTTKLYVPD